MKYSKYSTVIIGSGIAGLYAALKIEQQVNLADGILLITKSKLGESNSRYAQGGMVGVIKKINQIQLLLTYQIQSKQEPG